MTGLNRERVYLDWNATAPLRPEARVAMLEAMDVVGNPSSVHAEGRAAKSIVERARASVAALADCDVEEVVFTSSATESIATALNDCDMPFAAPVEHDAVWSGASDWVEDESAGVLSVDRDGQIHFSGKAPPALFQGGNDLFFLQRANSETGVLQPAELPQNAKDMGVTGAVVFRDVVQAFGKVANLGRIPAEPPIMASMMAVSAHKIGGPKGVGATLAGAPSYGPGPFTMLIEGGGQEKGRRSGTENVIGIAGFGAAAEAARRDLEEGVWERVEKLRIILEETLAAAVPNTIFFGQESPRLPNTTCFAVPGWKGETQVMQMDLAGFAVSAGSACSSGKVDRASRVLLAMGFDEETASSAIRVSMGPTTTETEVMAFADAWIDAYRRRKARAA